MPENPELRKHFEEILGRPVDLDLDGVIVVRERVGIYALNQEGHVTSRDIGTTGDSSKACTPRWLLDVGGVARTGADGTARMLLSDFHCEKFGFEHPIIFVATPQARKPVYVTSIQTLAPPAQRDVRIVVFTWDPAGNPAPHVSFDWRCWVPCLPIVE
jgi:hypothetical protein